MKPSQLGFLVWNYFKIIYDSIIFHSCIKKLMIWKARHFISNTENKTNKIGMQVWLAYNEQEKFHIQWTFKMQWRMKMIRQQIQFLDRTYKIVIYSPPTGFHQKLPQFLLQCEANYAISIRIKVSILIKQNANTLRDTYLRATETRCENGFSQAYILITWMPTTISFINLMRWSVLLAVRRRSVDIILPMKAKR